MTTSALTSSSAAALAFSMALTTTTSSSAGLMPSLSTASSSSSHPPPINFTNLITIKFSATNHLFWRAQVVSHLRSNLLHGYVDGTFPCPATHLTVTPEAGGTATSKPNPAYAA